MKRTPNVKDYFSLPLKDAAEIRSKVVMRDLAEGEVLCEECEGSGKCDACGGSGEVVHLCNCDFCDRGFEDCDECMGNGKCLECRGKGYYKVEAQDATP